MRIQFQHPEPAIVCALLLAVPILNGCAGVKAGPRPDGLEPGGTVITRDDIEGMNVRTALEAVERRAKHLLIQRTREGTPVRIYHRGIDSIYLDGSVQIIVDGILMGEGVHALQSLPSAHVEFIQILSAREGTTRYGALAGAGVIVVRTNAGQLIP